MKTKRFWIGAAFLLVAFMGGQISVHAAEKKSGPKIEIPEEEWKSSATEEHELQRGITFGKFHFFGYGELHGNQRIGTTDDEIDFHRLVLGFGADLTEKIIFRSELDFEHAFTEPELEFAYLDFLLHRSLNIRGGSLLVPMGVINQHHEPPLFYSVERPELYRVIIPTTWQEGGAGFHGALPKGFDYELYALSSTAAVVLNADGSINRSFTGNNGIRGGRGHVAEAPGHDFSGAGRLQYKGVPGLRLGTSVLAGNTGQGNATIDGGFLAMVEGDARYSFAGIDLEGIVAFTNLNDAGNINNVLVTADPTFTNFVARQMLGWYLEGAYHLFTHLWPETRHDLVLFSRFEDFNTQFKMPAGFAANPANDRNTLTTGLSYLPIPQVAIKADYMTNWNQANGGTDQLNVGLGFYY